MRGLLRSADRTVNSRINFLADGPVFFGERTLGRFEPPGFGREHISATALNSEAVSLLSVHNSEAHLTTTRPVIFGWTEQ